MSGVAFAYNCVSESVPRLHIMSNQLAQQLEVVTGRTYGNGLHKQGGAGREIRFNIAGVERGGDDPLITIYTAIRAQTPLSHCPVMSVPRTSCGALLVVCRLWDLQIYSACRACQSRVRVAQASL